MMDVSGMRINRRVRSGWVRINRVDGEGWMAKGGNSR
jgi:hypothetical protein